MRTLVLGLTALFLLPTVLALPPASLTPPLPSNASILPLNALDNGGFESGLASWTRYGHPAHPLPIVSPGAASTGGAFLSVNQYYGGGIFQGITPPVDVGSDLLLDFYAQDVTSAARNGNNEVVVMSHWNPATGAGEVSLRITFTGTNVEFLVWGGTKVVGAAPSDGAWHHYQAVMAGPLGLGALLIDGLPMLDASGLPALATGDPASVDAPNLVLLGDTAWCDCSKGPAPDVTYDEFYLGPQI